MSKICEMCGGVKLGRYSKKLCDLCYGRGYRSKNKDKRKLYYLENKEKIRLNYIKNKDKPTGKTCVECGGEIIERAIKDMCQSCYMKILRSKNNKTLDYMIKRKYRCMVLRTKKYNFSNIITREKFYEFARNSPELKILHEVWIESGYKLKLAPSVDRIDNNRGYVSGNIQFITQSENSKKGHVENPPRPRSIKCKLVKGDEVLYFDSMRAASRFLGLNKTAVCQNIKKGSTTLSGWKPYLVDEDEEK